MAEREKKPLNDKSTIEEVRRAFIRGKKIFDELCVAYQGMTWEEHERLHGIRSCQEGDVLEVQE